MNLLELVQRAFFERGAREALLVRVLRLHPLLKVIPKDDNDNDNGLYLVRHYILHVARHRLPGVYLHFINRSDADREIHSHPWDNAASVILWGGYVERRLSLSETDFQNVLHGVFPLVDQARKHWQFVERTLRPGDLNVITKTDFHRLTLTSRFALTLFITGRRTQEWGFLDTETGRFETEAEREARLKASRDSAPRDSRDAASVALAAARRVFGASVDPAEVSFAGHGEPRTQAQPSCTCGDDLVAVLGAHIVDCPAVARAVDKEGE